MAKAEGHGETKAKNKSNPRNPIKKYTKGVMLKVHSAYPMAALCNIDHKIIDAWETHLNKKLLIQPFGTQALDTENHEMLKALMFRAIIESNIAIAEPTPKHPSRKTPVSFLVYNLSVTQKQTLLQKEV